MTIRTASFISGLIYTGVLLFNGFVPDWAAMGFALIFSVPTITE